MPYWDNSVFTNGIRYYFRSKESYQLCERLIDELDKKYFDELFEFFYNAFRETEADNGNKCYRVFVARRCFILGCHFLRLFKGISNIDIDFERTEPTICSDGGLRIVAAQMAQDFFDNLTNQILYDTSLGSYHIYLYDDILIHGRSIGGLLSAAEDIFIQSFLRLCSRNNLDVSISEDDLRGVFLKSVTIKTAFANYHPSLLNERHKVLFNDDAKYLRTVEWRERSYRYSKAIFDLDIPNAAFIPALGLSSIGSMEYIRESFFSHENQTEGFSYKQSVYQGRVMDSYFAPLFSKGKTKCVLSLRCTKDYIIPFVFLPAVSKNTLAAMFGYVFYRIGKAVSDRTMEARFVNLLLDWVKIDELGTMLSELMDLVLSVSLLRAFLDSVNIPLKESEKDNISLDIMSFNYAHNPEIEELISLMLSPKTDSVFSLLEIKKLLHFFFIKEEGAILGGRYFYDNRVDKIDTQLEDLIYEHGINSEKAAYKLSVGSLSPSSDAIEYFILPYENALDNFFVSDNKDGEEEIDFVSALTSFLQFMDMGCVAITTGVSDNRFIHCVRTGEQSLTIEPFRQARFLPILIEIENRCHRQGRLEKKAFFDEFEDFFRQLHYYDFTYRKEYDLYNELKENKEKLIKFANGIYESGQHLRDYDFIVDYSVSQPDDYRSFNKEFYYSVVY